MNENDDLRACDRILKIGHHLSHNGAKGQFHGESSKSVVLIGKNPTHDSSPKLEEFCDMYKITSILQQNCHHFLIHKMASLVNIVTRLRIIVLCFSYCAYHQNDTLELSL